MFSLYTFLNSIKCTTACASLVFAFYTVLDLTLFLSDPNYYRKLPIRDSSWSWALLNNMVLLTIFIIQHSLLVLPQVKQIFNYYNLKDLQRCIYVILTCTVIQVLTKNWLRTHSITFWKLNLDKPNIFYLYVTVHSLAWLLIYIGTICMDVNELLGLKQVYYSIRNFPEPEVCKSYELQRLYNHMRHPSFIAFLIIFWITPELSLDRFLLASIMTSYMYLAWKTDDSDYRYQKNQYDKKFVSKVF